MSELTPSRLSFAQFADAMRPTGAVNRFPAIGGSADVYTYSVYMNGPMAKALPPHAQEHTYKDVTLQALTQKLDLNPLSARDNLKVAELVSLRSAWMSAVLETAVVRDSNAAQILDDYTILSEGMEHPWITAELERQRELSAKLGPTLARAGLVKDAVPKEMSIGKVLAQNSDFTLQSTQDGEVVTHENRRLEALPPVGEAVMVSYYRGTGQVVDSLDKAKFSEPFVDPATEDIAVRVSSLKGAGSSRVVLFNSVQSFDLFVTAHGLHEDLVQKAFDARAARPKTNYKAPPREPVGLPYIDASACIALDYVEDGVTYTALFDSAEAMSSRAPEFGIGGKALAVAYSLEDSLQAMVGSSQSRQSGGLTPASGRLEGQKRHDLSSAFEGERLEKSSALALRHELTALGYAFPQKSGNENRTYTGPVVAVSALHVAQDVGRRKVVIHDIRTLDKAPSNGDRLNVHFGGGRGVVTDMVKAQKDRGR